MRLLSRQDGLTDATETA